MAKKYFWLKLQRDFFKRHDIRIIEDMPNGKDYILFYMKLLVESIDHEGCLRFSETIPYNEQMLSTITNTNVDIVRSALQVFEQLQMVDILDDSTIFMTEVEKMIGSETPSAKWMRDKRARDKCLPSHCEDNVEKSDREIDIEKEKDKEKDIKHKYGEYKNVLLTDNELEKLKNEYPDYLDRIENLSNYVASTGKSYKSHYATIRNWARKDNKPVVNKKQYHNCEPRHEEGYFDELESMLTMNRGDKS